jgi:TRAP-type C4-dicarboxylate transport system permease small subunit
VLRAATQLRRGVAAVVAFMAWAAGWNYVACALFITGDIIGRNLFGVSSAATVEITGYMLACGIAWALPHTLACRAHIRVDVLVTRLPAKLRAPLHLFSLALLIAFAVFTAWVAWELVNESALFDAHDNSALRIPMVIPQGIWAVGITAFLVMALVLMLESVLALLLGQGEQLDRLLGSRTIDDEAEEALEAVAMAREGGSPA